MLFHAISTKKKNVSQILFNENGFIVENAQDCTILILRYVFNKYNYIFNEMIILEKVTIIHFIKTYIVYVSVAKNKYVLRLNVICVSMRSRVETDLYVNV